jgi:hypothetical protein
VISTPEAPVLPLFSQGINGRHEEWPRIAILGCASVLSPDVAFRWC